MCPKQEKPNQLGDLQYPPLECAAPKKLSVKTSVFSPAPLVAKASKRHGEVFPLLKNFIFAAGTLLAATIGVNGPAAAANRAGYGQRAMAMHRAYPRKVPFVSRGRFVAQRTRPVYNARFAYGRGRIARTYQAIPRRAQVARRFVPQHRRFATYRPAYTHRLAARNVRLAGARRDTMIQNYVGPQTDYTPVTGGTQVGNASYYGGGRTASGGVVGAATCAHRTLPFGTRVLVTNLANARRAILTVNDRGPFIAGRIVDVSTGAAGVLGMLHSGTAPVRVQVIGGRG